MRGIEEMTPVEETKDENKSINEMLQAVFEKLDEVYSIVSKLQADTPVEETQNNEPSDDEQ